MDSINNQFHPVHSTHHLRSVLFLYFRKAISDRLCIWSPCCAECGANSLLDFEVLDRYFAQHNSVYDGLWWDAALSCLVLPFRNHSSIIVSFTQHSALDSSVCINFSPISSDVFDA